MASLKDVADHEELGVGNVVEVLLVAQGSGALLQLAVGFAVILGETLQLRKLVTTSSARNHAEH